MTTMEKRIGDFSVTVEQDNSANGPFVLMVYGGPHPRCLAVRFPKEEDAIARLYKVSSRDLMKAKF